MAEVKVTATQLLEAGVQFGHQTSRWNPKMKPYILMQEGGINIINLFKTIDGINQAYAFLKRLASRGGVVLFVGTKKQSVEVIEKQASRVGMPYVSDRWLGGMLTNFQTVSKRVARMKELEDMDFDELRASGLTKKELLLLEREKNKLVKELGGIRDMNRLPQALFVIDTNKEALAVDEARKLHIPVVALADTNSDPDKINYPIPANDDSISSITLLTTLMADAVAEGLLQAGRAKNSEKESAQQPLAEWETDLLEGQGQETK